MIWRYLPFWKLGNLHILRVWSHWGFYDCNFGILHGRKGFLGEVVLPVCWCTCPLGIWLAIPSLAGWSQWSMVFLVPGCQVIGKHPDSYRQIPQPHVVSRFQVGEILQHLCYVQKCQISIRIAPTAHYMVIGSQPHLYGEITTCSCWYKNLR